MQRLISQLSVNILNKLLNGISVSKIKFEGNSFTFTNFVEFLDSLIVSIDISGTDKNSGSKLNKSSSSFFANSTITTCDDNIFIGKIFGKMAPSPSKIFLDGKKPNCSGGSNSQPNGNIPAIIVLSIDSEI